MEDISKIIKENIEREIKTKGWTYVEVAEIMGESRSSVCNKLSNRHKGLNTETIAKFANALDVPFLILCMTDKERKMYEKVNK